MEEQREREGQAPAPQTKEAARSRARERLQLPSSPNVSLAAKRAARPQRPDESPWQPPAGLFGLLPNELTLQAQKDNDNNKRNTK